MVQTIQPTYYGNDLKQGLTQGFDQGNQLAMQLLPLIMQQQKRNALYGQGQPKGTASIFPQGQGSQAPGMGVPQNGSPSESPLADNNPDVAGWGKIISPEEINRIASQYPGDPQEAIQALDQHNARIQNQQNLYRSSLQERLPSVQTESDKAVLDRFRQDPEFRGIRDPVQLADRIAKKAEPYFAARESFMKDAGNRPNALREHGKYANKLKSLHSKAQQFVERGQFNDLYGDLAKQGWSDSEVMQILNPLSSETKSQIKAQPRISTNSFLSEQGRQNAAKASERLESEIAKVFKPGVTNPQTPGLFKPGTSLVLLRNEYAKKGVPFMQFDRMINRLTEQGKIKLDPMQQKESQLLTETPNRTFSIWESLFGPQ